MSARIPQSFIDQVLDRTDIVELVDARVKLKKSGKNYSACCPFHEEKTPSFTVTQEKQFYYCFGCGASGNAIGFVMEYDRLSFPEAVEQLARAAGLEVPRPDRPSSPQERAREKDRRTIYTLLEAANDFYQQALRQHPESKRAVTYLQNRGLSGEITRDFGVGFAPPGWDNLLRTLGEDMEDRRLLLESGMLVQREDSKNPSATTQASTRVYDRFRDRIMFPIRDVRGRVIGFGGRVLGDEKPKYLNSPESPVFHKGEELYGLYEARQANSQLKRLLVVEGYMDVVALSQFGISYAVATLGTACREEHLNKAFRYSQEVVFCFDGDAAGRMAARRALENSLPTMHDGRQIKFLFLPEGEDPDTLVRRLGAKKFSALIDHALPLEDFFFDVLTEELDPRSMEGRARLSKLAAPMLDRLPKGVYRELMFNNLAKRTGLDVSILLELTQEAPADLPGAPDASHSPEARQETRGRNEHVQRGGMNPASSSRAASQLKLPAPRLLTLLLLHHPELASSIEEVDELVALDNENLTLFIHLLQLLHQRPHFTTAQVIGHLQGAGEEMVEDLTELTSQLGELVIRAGQVPDYDPKREFLEILERLQRQHRQRRATESLDKLRAKPFASLSEEEKQSYRQILSELASDKLH